MYDVAIVGARCAGSSLALLLARRGYKVLMIDRASFPSDTMSGHYIHPAGVACLHRWGVLDTLAGTDTPPQARVTFDTGAVTLTGGPTPTAEGIAVGYGPRRWLFDTLLAHAAVAAGAELWDSVTFEEPQIEDGVVTGVVCRTKVGTRVAVSARLVVGADGKRSRFADAVGAAKYNVHASTGTSYYSYWEGFDAPHTHLFTREGNFFVVMPTNNGQTFIGIDWPITEFTRIKADIDAAFHAAAARIPWIAERLANAVRTERYVGSADLEGFFRVPYGRGWALNGDAGYHKDPITAQGMTDAFVHAEMLVEAIDSGLSGRAALDAAMSDFHRKRDGSVLPMYEFTNALAKLAPPRPEDAALFEALQFDAAGTERFFGVIAGTVPVQDFFSPASIETIMGARQVA